LLGDLESVVNLNAEVLTVFSSFVWPKEQLDGTQVSDSPVD
jgi:hypothetical protein